jgi:hypothetical protein
MPHSHTVPPRTKPRPRPQLEIIPGERKNRPVGPLAHMRARAPGRFLGLGQENPPLPRPVFGPVNPTHSIRSNGRVTFPGEQNRGRLS